MRRKPQPEKTNPAILGAALHNLGSRIEKLENRTILTATEALHHNVSVGSAKGGSPPTSIETATSRILEIMGRVNRATFVVAQLADVTDGSAPTSSQVSEPATTERPHLHAAISMLERATDSLFDQLGRIHPNPRS